MDELAAYTQPRCPSCGTVLITVAHGYVCRSCRLAYSDQVLMHQAPATAPQRGT